MLKNFKIKLSVKKLYFFLHNYYTTGKKKKLFLTQLMSIVLQKTLHNRYKNGTRKNNANLNKK